MARIPIQRETVAPAGAGQVPAPRLSGTGTGGAALVQLGQATGDAADRLQRQAERDAQIEAGRIAAETELEIGRTLEEERTNMQPGGEGFYDTMQERFDALSGAAAEGASSDLTREILNRRMQAVRTQTLLRATQLESAERLRKRQSDISDTIELNRNLVISDPGLLKTKLLETEILIGGAGLTPEMRDRLQEQAQEGLASSALSTLIQRDPIGTGERLREGEFDQFIDPDQKASFLAQAVAEVERRLRVERAEFKSLQDDHLASIQETGRGIPGYSDQAGAMLEGQALEDFRKSEQIAQETHVFASRIEYATPEEINAVLLAEQPQSGSRTFADELRSWEHKRKKAAAMIQQRNADPGGAVATMPEVGELWRAAESGSGPTFEEAAQMSLEMQEEIGIPASIHKPLPAGRSRALVEQITQTPPAGRASIMADIQGRFGQQYLNVMQQLVADGLPAEYQVLSLVAGDALLSQQLATTIDIDESELKRALDAADVKEAKAQVLDNVTAFSEAVNAADPTGGRIQQLNGLYSVMQKHALAQMRQGAGVSDAAEIAANIVLDRFEVIESMYVPRVIGNELVDMNQIQRFADMRRDPEMVRSFQPEGMGDLSGQVTEEMQVNAVVAAAGDESRSYWATKEDGSGAFLMIRLTGGGALPLLNAAGQRYEFDFLDASRSSIPAGAGMADDTGQLDVGGP